MKIILHTDEIIKRIRSVSHSEVSQIENPDVRYRAEAGTEKMQEIHDCIMSAASKLSGRCSRWLKSPYWETDVRDNKSDIPTFFEYEFILSERRLPNTEALLSEMHSFMIEYALSKFYSDVNQGELSNKHSLLALEAGNSIDQILYTKQPPRV